MKGVRGRGKEADGSYLFFPPLFFSEESYRACRRNMIHKRIQRNVWPGPKRFNKFFFPLFRVQSSLQLRQLVPFPTEQTIISSVWFHLEKRLIDQRTFDKHPFFLALSIHDTTIDHLSNVGKVDTFISLFSERISSFVSLANATQRVKGWTESLATREISGVIIEGVSFEMSKSYRDTDSTRLWKLSGNFGNIFLGRFTNVR